LTIPVLKFLLPAALAIGLCLPVMPRLESGPMWLRLIIGVAIVIAITRSMEFGAAWARGHRPQEALRMSGALQPATMGIWMGIAAIVVIVIEIAAW
jgi:hypothetical protein